MMFNYPYLNSPYYNRYSRYGYRYPYYNSRKENINIEHNNVVEAGPVSARGKFQYPSNKTRKR